MNSINIQLSLLVVEDVPPIVIDKLYEYALLSKVEDLNNELELTLSGNIRSFAGSEQKIRYLAGIDATDNPKFPNLTISVPSSGYYVDISDPVVKLELARAIGGSAHGGVDGEILLSLVLNTTEFHRMFYNMNITSFPEIYLFRNLNKLGECFKECNIQTLKIPENITTIGGDWDFYKANVENLYLYGIKNIGLATFLNTSINNLYIDSLENYALYVMNGSSSFPFHGARHIYINGRYTTDLVLPNGITEFDNRYGSSCITSITLPDSVTTIKNYALLGLINITSFTIPINVLTIGNYFMYSNIFLTELIVLPTTPPTIQSNSIESRKVTTIYVPDESLLAYKEATYWSNFASKIKPISERPVLQS